MRLFGSPHTFERLNFAAYFVSILNFQVTAWLYTKFVLISTLVPTDLNNNTQSLLTRTADPSILECCHKQRV